MIDGLGGFGLPGSWHGVFAGSQVGGMDRTGPGRHAPVKLAARRTGQCEWSAMSPDRQPETFDIVIVGGSYRRAGPRPRAGLALEHQARIAILERQRSCRVAAHADPRAYALSAGSKRMLEALGVWAGTYAAGRAGAAIDITDSGLEHAIRSRCCMTL